MKIETAKGIATLTVAAVAILGTLLVVAYLTIVGTLDAPTGIGYMLAIAGPALTYLFSNEIAKGRQSAYEKGLNTPAPEPAAVTIAESASYAGICSVCHLMAPRTFKISDGRELCQRCIKAVAESPVVEVITQMRKPKKT